MPPPQRLEQFLSDAFSAGELLRWVESVTDDSIAAELPGENSPRADIARAVVNALRTRRIPAETIFTSLSAARPHRSDELAALRQRWVVRRVVPDDAGKFTRTIVFATGGAILVGTAALWSQWRSPDAAPARVIDPQPTRDGGPPVQSPALQTVPNAQPLVEAPTSVLATPDPSASSQPPPAPPVTSAVAAQTTAAAWQDVRDLDCPNTDKDCSRKPILSPSDCGAFGGAHIEPRYNGEPATFVAPVPPELCKRPWRLPAIAGVGAGGMHLCVVLVDGSAMCWGDNRSGELGYGDEIRRQGPAGYIPVERVAVGGYVREVAAGDSHTCARLSDGTVRCWGEGQAGRLGYDDSDDIGARTGQMPPPAVTVGAPTIRLAAGAEHTCAIVKGGSVRCWGSNDSEQLGVDELFGVGGKPFEMPPRPVGNLTDAVEIVAGRRHNCVLLADRRVRCWGQASQGQLGQGSTAAFGRESERHPPPEVQLGGTVAQIAAGADHTCARMTDGALRCWGSNRMGQLGYGHREPLGDQPEEMPPPDVQVGGVVVDIALGDDHTCALLDSGKVRCWGGAEEGQLGDGARLPAEKSRRLHPDAPADPVRDNVGDDPDEMPPADVPGLPRARRIYGHLGSYTCALLVDGTLRCWGNVP